MASATALGAVGRGFKSLCSDYLTIFVLLNIIIAILNLKGKFIMALSKGNHPLLYYNLLHQEIKACAEHVFEISNNKEANLHKDCQHVVARLHDLYQICKRVQTEERYLSLLELKTHLETTTLCFENQELNTLHSIRLSEAISILALPEGSKKCLSEPTYCSLKQHFLCYFMENIQPEQVLFQKLKALKDL